MYSPMRHVGSIFWKRQPLHLTFFVTRRCNANCAFCFYLRNADHVRTDTKELTLKEIQVISRSLGKLLWVAFSGGEPYLRKDLVAISKVFYAQNKPAVMLYPSNGLLPEMIKERTERILEHCTKSVIVVKLSIDGLNGDHDALRNTSGAFAKVMQTYRLLEKLLDLYSNFELGINTVFCSENQEKMGEIMEFVRGLGNVGTHTISMIRGNLIEQRYKQVDYRKYAQAIKTLEEDMKTKASSIYRFNGARMKAAQDIVQRRLIHKTILAKRRLLPCYAGELNLVLSESGEVYPCEMLSTGFGNIRDCDYDMKAITRSKKAQALLASIRNERCYCSHECYFITNILFNFRLYPTLVKEYLRLRGD